MLSMWVDAGLEKQCDMKQLIIQLCLSLEIPLHVTMATSTHVFVETGVAASTVWCIAYLTEPWPCSPFLTANSMVVSDQELASAAALAWATACLYQNTRMVYWAKLTFPHLFHFK